MESSTAPGPVAEIMGRIAFELAAARPFIPMYFHLVLSALFPIYTGAHASLSRPSSAAKPHKKARNKATDDESSEDEDTAEQKMEGLSPSDAIVLPIFAGCTLAALYFIIRWLEDPAILNKILGYYFSSFGILSVAKLATDALQVLHSFVFPKRYVYQRMLYEWRPELGVFEGKQGQTTILRDSPLPGLLGSIPLHGHMRSFLTSVRTTPAQKVGIKLYIHKTISAKTHIGLHGFLGLTIGFAAVLYFTFVDKPWWLTNVLGFGFSYGALQLLSPTTFWTGNLILGALFFYDIYFVFYTPMMVTVAKSLDVPIKLLFPRPHEPSADITKPPQLSMLGLGDIVLPGIMIGLALRFDLYMFYWRKQKKIEKTRDNVEVEMESDSYSEGSRLGNSTGSSKDKDGGHNERTTKQQQIEIIKAPYRNVGGAWGERFWTSSTLPLTLSASHLEPSSFPKTYFHASIVGYVLGMLATLGVMQVYAHAQPALLYLVPGVLGSLFLTALTRGELQEMYAFTDADEDIEDGENSREGDARELGEQKDSKEREKKQSTSWLGILSKGKHEKSSKKVEKALAQHVEEDDVNESSAEREHEPTKTSHMSKGSHPDGKPRQLFSLVIEGPPPRQKHVETITSTLADGQLENKERKRSSIDESNGVVRRSSKRQRTS